MFRQVAKKSITGIVWPRRRRACLPASLWRQTFTTGSHDADGDDVTTTTHAEATAGGADHGKNNTADPFPKSTELSKGAVSFLPCAFSLSIPTDLQKDLLSTTGTSKLESLTSAATNSQSDTVGVDSEEVMVTPLASNPVHFPKAFTAAMVPRPSTATTSTRPGVSLNRETKKEKRTTWGTHLAQNGVRVTWSAWIQILDISPNSSLEAMLDVVEKALDEELERGIVNLDKPFVPHKAAPMLRITDKELAVRREEQPHPYVAEAKLVLSPFGRPSGWYVRLAHRSLAQALLVRYRSGTDFIISSKKVKVQEYRLEKTGPKFQGSFPVISDATIRVENCPNNLKRIFLLNFFSRFDLSMKTESIVPWQGVTPDGKESSSPTFLIHFADPSWARAAIRERQGANINGANVRLVQFPRQLLSRN